MKISERLKELNRKIEFSAAVGLTILGFLVTNIITFEGFRTHDLEAVLTAERAAYEAQLRQRDKDIEEVLPDQLETPLLTYPHNRASLVTNYIRLQWREGKQQHPSRAYTVEIAGPNADGRLDLLNREEHLATDPLHTSTTIRIDPGPHLWRVKRGPSEAEATWSPYFYFENFATSKSRIRQTGILTIGTFLSPLHSEMACPLRPGVAISELQFDNVIISAICEQLASLWHFNRIRFVTYPTPDTLVFSGVKDGNVDLAVSALSDTKGRTNHGVLFSKEYLQNHVVLATAKNVHTIPSGGIRVGVVKGGTNAEFAHELSRRQLVSVAEAESLQELLKMLQNNEVRAIIVDEPIVDTQVKNGDVVVMRHLTKGLSGWMNHLVMSAAVDDARVGLAVAVHDAELQIDINRILGPGLIKQAQDQLFVKD
jgi:ABC-type amino acid transport substrate-binding protein